MDFRNQQQHPQQHDDIGLSASSLYSPSPSPQLRASAFSKPTLPTSSSLLAPRPTQTAPPPNPQQQSRNGAIFSPATLTPPPTTHDHSAQITLKPTDPTPIAAKTPTTEDHESTVKYRECLRNHAASIGGHVVDGCGEFMPGTTDALKCGACSCHRSFHRKEVEGETTGSSYYLSSVSPASIPGSGGRAVPLLLPPPHRGTGKQFQLPGFPSTPTSRAVPFSSGNPSGSGGTTESSSEERLNVALTPTGTAAPPRKRFRTKFSSEQKEKMMEFAEQIGWRIQRQDEGVVDRFCGELGVKRQVFKVWMHNNKHVIKKQGEGPGNDQQQQHYEVHSDLHSSSALQH